ncbi:MAG: ATP-binding protein [Erysipelotrichaceae bacterium]|jgi:anti-sigma regulatory factor (Ser/Thr protein kinase)|nr:ATP-binding protein [Erysipelotrichaceae bacterium]MCR5300712.1 ATP-binding protein [Erysipelotrichaceae bacterium]
MSVIYEKIYNVERDDYANAGLVSSLIKQSLRTIGISPAVSRRVAVAVYEAEINMIIHAYGGTITLQISDDGMIRLIAKDKGPGIPDIEKALTPGFSTASKKAMELGFGAGMGLPNIKRNADEFSIESSPAGTTLDLKFQERE